MLLSSTLLQLSLLGLASHSSAAAIEKRLLSRYAPVSASCPSTPLIRDASSLGSCESAYIAARKPQADAALAAWLQKTDPSFPTTNLPTLGLVASGGGYRAALSAAGVVQGMDGRESNLSTSGLFQALTYQSALSGGGWFTSSLIGLNWPTISYLRDNIWAQAFADSLLVPANLLSAVAYDEIVNDIVAKDAAGFSPTLVDVYGRLLSYQLLSPEAQDLSTDGAVTKTLSSVVSASNFTNHAVPFPIITSRGINTFQGKCMADLNATQYEFTPYDFGSWDAGVKAFTQTQYLGSRLTNGAPSVAGKCIKNYDNLGYVAGTTSDIFNSFCGAPAAKNNTQSLAQTLEAIVLNAHSPLTSDLYAPYPNPFYQSANSPLVSAQKTLQLADGGEGQANVPIWPLIQPERNLDVLIVSDNSADTSDNWPTGIALQTAYQQASLVNLTKMPFIPSTDVFISQGLNKRATFFGCGDNATVTIVYLPNNDYVYASNIGTVTIQTSKEETAGIIANGNQIVAQGGDEQWATCLGCAIVGKSGGALPEACGACFDKYCYKQ